MRHKTHLNCIQICLFLFVFAEIAKGQTIALYETDGVHGKYVFSRNYQNAAGATVSEVIIADTFSFQKKSLESQVTMSNAYVFSTKIERGTTNIVQYKVFDKSLVINLPRGSQIISNGSILGSSTGNSPKAKATTSAVYEGDAALKKVKKMGLGLPDDYDHR